MENSRRAFVKTLMLGVAAAVAAPIVKLQNVFAADKPASGTAGAAAQPGVQTGKMVDPNTDATAKALGYVPDVGPWEKKPKDSKVPKKWAKGQKCAGCQFYADASGKSTQAKCQLIQSGDVSAKGWCNSFSARAKA